MIEPAHPGTIPASTLVVFRRGAADGGPEFLMVQRAKEMRFAGGAAVFPGGRIDPEDIALARKLQGDGTLDQAAARIAAIRETLEETGLAIGLSAQVSSEAARQARALLLEAGALASVIDQMGWQLDLDSLEPFARWCPNWPGSFDTHFFLADLGTGAVDLAVDATENTRLFWASAAQALNMAETGEITVIFPTRRNLERLAVFPNYAEAQAQARSIPIQTITPKSIEREGETFLTIPEGMGYPVTEQNFATVRRG